jgi:cell division protein FtsI/penicillin-binding protein 2
MGGLWIWYFRHALQMLRAYCAAANGGILVKPYIIKSNL